VKNFILISILFTTILFSGCGLIATSSTVSTENQNLVKQHTSFQIEILRRYKDLDTEKLEKFLKKNVEVALALELILVGENDANKAIYEEICKELEEKNAKKDEAKEPEEPAKADAETTP
jgi:hypothetical protein